MNDKSDLHVSSWIENRIVNLFSNYVSSNYKNGGSLTTFYKHSIAQMETDQQTINSSVLT